MNVASLKHQISKGNIKNVYLFSGPEISDKKEVISIIEQQLNKLGEVDKFLFNGADLSEDTNLFDALSSGMLFSAAKLVIVSNIENANAKFGKNLEEYLLPLRIDANLFETKLLPTIQNKKNLDLIKKIYKQSENKNYYTRKNTDEKKSKIKISDKKQSISLLLNAKIINPDTYLILMTDTNAKVSNEILNLFDDTIHIVFWEMFENQKQDWINQQFRKKNLFIEREAVLFILEMIENNKEKLLFEIEKIISLFYDLVKEKSQESQIKKNNVVSREFIEDYLYHSREESPFTLFNLILETNINNYQQNLPRILEILEKLFFTDERQLFNIFIWSMRKFITAIDLFENEKYSYEKVFSTLRITSKKNKENYIAGFNNYSFQHCAILFYKLSQMDYYLKVLPAELKLIKFQEFIINFVYGDIQKSFLQGEVLYYQL